jgi:hypothetical protein
MKKNILKKVAIVVPIYKPLNQDEKISFAHLKKHLVKFDRFMVMPETLPQTNIPTAGFQIIRFPDNNFSSVYSYSCLMNTKDFYEQFTGYEYILIYQLDALVFSNELLKWCNKGYDYIGAPWFTHIIGDFCTQKGLTANVGNGGFSLRKVASFLKVINTVEKTSTKQVSNHYLRKLYFIISILTGKSHKKWLNTPPSSYPFNEDGFWSFEAPKYLKKFKIAPFNEALQFAFEKEPERCFKLNNGKLPFGCHAWSKYNPIFWKKYITR